MKSKLIVAVLSGILFFSGYVYANDQNHGSMMGQNMAKGKNKAVEVENKICPVSGDKVPAPGEKGEMGEAVKYEYNGKIYNLCCPMCIKDFQKNPEKYSRIAEEEVASQKKDNAMPLQSVDPKLKTSYVCMMNNKYFGTEQIPVEVEGKTYYGCCQGCVASLKNNPAIRYGKDPYSGEEVDKATAYIVLNSDGSQNVLYFKSAENYANYLNKK